MKNPIYKITMLLVLGTMAFLQSCQKDEQLQTAQSPADLKDQNVKTFYGPTVPMGNGVARAWVQENPSGEPLAVGINLSDKALEGLPDVPTAWVLQFPPNKGTYFYKHMLVDWNPQGHEPPFLYGVPHFDFHFYWISNEDRLQIGPPGAPQFNVFPAPEYIPEHYVPGAGVPQMGTHWVDTTSAEFTGGGFTKTFILGSWDGSLIFYEPMITRSYLLTQPNVTVPVPQPEAFQRDGWYPLNYCISYSTTPKQYTVSLTNLMYREGE